MKKHLVAIALSLLSATAFAASSSKTTYKAADLAHAGVHTVSQVVEKYAADTGTIAPTDSGSTLVLVDGQRDPLGATDADSKLATSKSVEVLSNGKSFVVNILTR